MFFPISVTTLLIMENQYLQILRDVLENGHTRETRNSVTKSLFGKCISFDLADGFPLLTTKKVFFRGVVEELGWFLRGSTDAKELIAKKVHIWDGNSEKNNYDCGAVYGFQWRHYGAKYIDCKTDYTDCGVDQVQNVIDLLKNDPTSRRMIINAWNPSQMEEMCLPPCHVMYQFYVEYDDRVSVMLTQRSADIFLGVPFNIASTSLLLTLICQNVGRKPGRVIINIGDAHIYENHDKAVKIQLSRTPTELPVLLLKTDNIDLWKLQYDDLLLIERSKTQSKIKAKMIA
jgi:thymidylate synthase